MASVETTNVIEKLVLYLNQFQDKVDNTQRMRTHNKK